MTPRRLRLPKRLNVKVAILLLLVAGLLSAGVYFLHELQVKRTADVMLQRAKKAQSAGNPTAAVRFYLYYVHYAKDDHAAYSTLAMLMADQAEKAGANRRARASAYSMLERAARQDPDNETLLRRLADYSVQLGRMSDAAGHYKRLVQMFPEDTDLEVKLGRCQIATEHFREAIATFQALIGRDPRNTDAYVELADLFRDKLEDIESADATMHQMVAANPEWSRAYAQRARYWQRADKLESAEADIAKALELAPEGLDVLLTAAELRIANKDLQQARELLDRAAKRFPDDQRLHQTLASLDMLEGKTDAAISNLQKAEDDPKSLYPLVELHLKSGDVSGVRQTLKKMRKAGYRPEILEYYEARLLVTRRKWQEAVKALEQLRTKVSRWREVTNRVDLVLGLCYGQLGLWDRQREVYRRVLNEDPESAQARAGYALALFHTGKTDEALRQYRKLEKLLGPEALLKVPGLRATFFQLLLIETAQLPEEKRDWSEAAEFLDRLEKQEGPGGVQLGLMRAELLVKSGQSEQARRIVVALRDAQPDQLILWTALANLTAIEDGPREALKVLDEASKRLGDSPALRLARAGLAIQMDRDEGRQVLASLDVDMDGLSDARKVDYWQRLGSAYYRLRDRQTARQLWSRAADTLPKNVQIRLALFELAYETGDEAGMREAAGAVKELLGPQSSEWNYCEASRIVRLIRDRKRDRKSLDEAKELLATAIKLRPSWHELRRLEAEIAMMEGRTDDAIEGFQRAGQLGTLRPLYLAQLVRLLYSQRRYDEAKEAMGRLGSLRHLPSMKKWEAQLDLRTGDLEQALELAAESVADSKRATDFLWYGQLLAQADKPDEALAAFRRAAQINPRIPQAWLAMVVLLANNDKKAEAEEVVRQAQVALPEDQLPLVLAQCYEILRDFSRAEQHYRSAAELDPDNLSVLRRVVRFYVRVNRAGQAREHLLRIIELAGKDPDRHRAELLWARRSLARVMALSGDYRQKQQALKLLEENSPDGKASLEDLRLKATILAAFTQRDARLKAVELFEKIREQGARLSPQEQFLLAQLYDQTKRWRLCQEQMLELLSRNRKETRFLAAYVQMLLNHDTSPTAVKPWLERLEKLNPDARAVTAIKAQLLMKKGQVDEGIKLLEGMIPRPLPKEQLGRLREVAAMLERLEQYDAAKKLLVEFAEKAPGGSLTLATFLARHGTLDEALDQCEAALKENVSPLAVISTAVAVLKKRLGEAGPEHFVRVDDWFSRALKDHPDAKTVRLRLAGFLDLQGNLDEAVKQYRDLLARDDLTDHERALVGNNLAFMLAASKTDGKEALRLVNNAMAVLGPSSTLLDTRAVAYLAVDQPQTAVTDLRRAIVEGPSATRYFHLALAHHEQGDRQAALRALKVGRENHQLSADIVPRVERDKYLKLIGALGLR